MVVKVESETTEVTACKLPHLLTQNKVIHIHTAWLIMMTFYKVLHLFICQVGFLAENRVLQKSIIFHQSRHPQIRGVQSKRQFIPHICHFFYTGKIFGE